MGTKHIPYDQSRRAKGHTYHSSKAGETFCPEGFLGPQQEEDPRKLQGDTTPTQPALSQPVLGSGHTEQKALNNFSLRNSFQVRAAFTPCGQRREQEHSKGP